MPIMIGINMSAELELALRELEKAVGIDDPNNGHARMVNMALGWVKRMVAAEKAGRRVAELDPETKAIVGRYKLTSDAAPFPDEEANRPTPERERER